MKKMLLATAALCGCNAAVAADVAEFGLGEVVVVTATRATNTSKHEDSITSADMRRFDRETVGSALALTSGVNLSKVGARNEQMVYVRGFDLRQVPVFIDGIPVYVPYDGYVDLGRFNTFDLARIDISKGFSSLVYGPNALGGTINLITKKPTSKFEGEFGGGSTFTSDWEGNSYRAYTNVGSNQGSWYAQASASYLEQDYFRLPDDFDAARGEDGGRRDNSDNKDRKYNLKLGYTPNDTDEYALNIIDQHGEKGTPPYAGSVTGVNPRYWQWPYWDKQSVYYISNTAIGEHQLKLRVFHDTFENSVYAYDDNTYTTQARPSSFRSWYDDYSNGASVEFDFHLGSSNILKTAAHWKEDIHREHNAGNPVQHFKDRTESFAVEDTHQFTDAFSLVAGVSYDTRDSLEAENYNSQTRVISDFEQDDNNATNAQLGAFYKVSDSGQLHATVARRNRFATVKDRYSYRLGTAIPNPSLDPERANHYEIGYSDTLANKWQWEANLFRSDISDLIQSNSIAPTACTTAPCTQMQNIGKARSEGVELSINGSIDRVELGANYTYLHRENRSQPNVRLIDTPYHSAFGYGVWHITEQWQLTGSVDASSSRYTTSNALQKTAGYAVTDLKAGYEFAGGISIEAGVHNLTDRLYELTEGFPEPGRTSFVQFNVPWSL